MKKICFVTTISATLSAFLMDFASYLHNSGQWEVTFICNTDDEFAKKLPEYIRYIPVPMKRGISFDGLRAVKNLKRIFAEERFDIVQYATPNAALYASVAARGSKVPVRIYTQWGIRYMGFESGWKRKLFKLLEKKVCKNSTRIEPESFGIRDFAVSEGLYAADKAEVVGSGSACGVDLHKFDISKKDTWRREIRSRHGLSDNEVVFGFAARLCRDKGINELLCAFRGAYEKWHGEEQAEGQSGKIGAKLLVMGGMDDESSLDGELLEWAEKCEDVIFCGRVTDVMKYYAALDVFVSPSYREGFGLVLIEAQAMGVPVIATDVPGQIDAFLPDSTGIAVRVRDAVTLEYALIRMYGDTDMRERMGERAHGFAAEGFEQNALFALLKKARDEAVTEINETVEV